MPDSSPATPRSYDSLSYEISTLRDAVISQSIISGFALALGFSILLLLGSMTLDNLLHFSSYIRTLLAPAVLVAVLAQAAVLIGLPFLRKPDEDDVALAVQKQFPALQNRVINAVQVGRDASATRDPFVSGLIDETWRSIRGLDVQSTAKKKRLRGRLAFASVAVLVGLGYIVLFPEYCLNAGKRFLYPNREIGRPGLATLALRPQEITVPIGGSLNIQVDIKGPFEKPVEIARQLETGNWERREMGAVEQNSFSYRFEDIRAGFVFRAYAGKAVSEEGTVRVVDRPGIASIALRYEFPTYTGMEPREVPESNGDINALVGMAVTVLARATRPLRQAKIAVSSSAEPDQASVVDMQLHDSTLMKYKLVVQNSGTYSFRIMDKDGVANEEGGVHTISAIPDSPPKIEIAEPERQLSVTPEATVDLRLAASDNFGVGKMQVRYTVAEKPEALLHEWDGQGNESFTVPHAWPLAALGLEPGDSVAYYATAADLRKDDVTGSGISRTPEYTITIIDEAEQREEKIENLSVGLEQLAEILELQKTNHGATGEVVASIRKSGPTQAQRETLGSATQAQIQIRAKSLDAALALREPHPAITESLEELAGNEMVTAVQQLQGANNVPDTEKQLLLDKLSAAAVTQEQIIARLEELLGRAKQAEDASKIQDLAEALADVEKEQRAVRELTAREGAPLDVLAAREAALKDEMEKVEGKFDKVAVDFKKTEPELAKAIQNLGEQLRKKELPQMMEEAQANLEEKQPEPAAEKQDQVIKELEKASKALKETLATNAARESEEFERAMRKQLQKAEKIAALEKNVTEAVEELEKLDEDKFSQEDEKKFDELAKLQQKIEDAAEKTANDLKCFPKIPFSNEMVKEWSHVKESVKASKEAMEKKAKTKALEANKKILEDLKELKERSKDHPGVLGNSPDKTKFDLENFDPEEIPEIPLVDLPEKLEDIVGDLIDKQEDQNEETNDKTSNWMKQDTASGVPIEGPISSFGAKGKTGNQLPDPSEISGRSGSGRSGKATGELVEGETKDLEGSPTPPRKTNDPIQEGFVNDKNTKMPSGATGGGKMGGDGGYGLPDNYDPKQDLELKNLARRQGVTRASAEQLEGALNQLYVPTGSLPQAIELMREIEQDLASYNLADISVKQEKALRALRNTYRALTGKAYIRAEGVVPIPKELQRQILEARDENFAPGFEKLLEQYYQHISDAATK